MQPASKPLRAETRAVAGSHRGCRDVTTSDLLAVTFPEAAFPPAASLIADHEAACRRGYAVMATRRVVLTGLARNLEAVLPLTIRRLERLGCLFRDHRVVVYENDSTDRTREILAHWAAGDGRVRLVTEDRRDPVNPTTRCLDRVGRMAAYRSRCQAEVLAAHGDFDCAIVVDLDILGGWSLDGIASSFGHDGWDFVGSNGLIYRRHGLWMNAVRQYDTWALRFDDRCRPLPTATAGGFVPVRGQPLVRVTSCFGGLGVYRMQAYAAGAYDGTDCEHVGFHRSLRSRGFGRLFLNPSQLLVYGRRHRTGDALAGRVLAAWARALGRPVPTWLFAAGAGAKHMPPGRVGADGGRRAA